MILALSSYPRLRGSVGRTTAYSGNCGLPSLSGSSAARSSKDQSISQTIWSRFTVEDHCWGTRSNRHATLFLVFAVCFVGLPAVPQDFRTSEPTAKPLIAHFCPRAKLTSPYQ